MINENPKAGITREIFEREKDKIFRIILEEEQRIRQESIKAEEFRVMEGGESWREAGTRSLTQVYSPEHSEEEIIAGSPNRRYFVKAVPLENTEDALTELAVTSVLEKYPSTKGIFPKRIGYFRAEDCHILVFERPNFSSLQVKFKDKKAVLYRDIIPALSPIISFNHNATPEVIREIEETLARYSRKYGAGRKINELNRLSPDEYALNWVKYALQGRKVNDSVFRELYKSALKISKKFFTRSSIECLVQHDGHSWNHLIEMIVDGGDIKKGSPIIQLGCLFTGSQKEDYAPGAIAHYEASIYRRLTTTGELSIEERKKAIRKIMRYYSGVRGIDPPLFETGIFSGLAYSNLRLTHGEYFNEKKKELFRKEALEQLMILAEAESSARRFANIYLNFV